jgi:hypothetical protein
MSIQLDFEKGTIKRELAELPEKMLEGASEALNDAADFMVVMAKSYVRVETGSLQKSIRKERGSSSQHRTVVRVRAGGYVINPKTGKLVNYAVHQEHYHPYMRPAWESVRNMVEQQIKHKVLDKVT